MSAPKESGWGSFGGLGGVLGEGKDAVDTLDEEEEKLSAPCFEAYWKGAWLEVTIWESRSERYLIRYSHRPDLEEAWISLNELRPRARMCDDWDCCILKVGVDVSVYCQHPQARGVSRGGANVSVSGRHLRAHQTRALYDAKIVSVAKMQHVPDCCCKFTIQFFSIKQTPASEFVHQRKLLPEEHWEVGTSKFRVLQQPGVIPLHEVIKDHLAHKWSPLRNRWYVDAYFLKETRLRIYSDPKMEEFETTPEGDTQQEDGTSGKEDLANVDTMNAYHSGGGEAPKSPVQKRTVLLSKHAHAPNRQFSSREDTQEGHQQQQGKKSSVDMQYQERGVKRKYDSVDDKETSNLVQEGNDLRSPGKSSRFTRSQEKISSSSRLRSHNQNAGQSRPSMGDIKDDTKRGKVVEVKRGRKLKLSDSESSSPEDLNNPQERVDDLNNPQERVDDSGPNREKGSDQDHDALKQRERHTKDSHLPRKDGLRNQNRAEQVFQGRSLRNSKQGKALDRRKGRLPVEETEQRRPSMQRVGKGRWPGDDPEQGKSVQTHRGWKRGHPKNPSGISISSGGNEELAMNSPRSMEGPLGRTKSSPDSHLENIGSHAANLDIQGSPGTEADFKRSKRGRSGKQVPELQERQATRQLSDTRKGTPANQRSITRKEQLNKADKKAGNDPGSEKSEGDCSTPSPNSKDPASSPGPQLRKLRPRRCGRPKNKYKTGSQSNTPSKSNKKDAEFKKKSSAEKVVARPLYMDLLGNNEDGDDREKAPCPPVKEQKPSTGLLDTWDPNPEDSEADYNKGTEEDRLMQKLWQDCYSTESPVSFLHTTGLPSMRGFLKFKGLNL